MATIESITFASSLAEKQVSEGANNELYVQEESNVSHLEYEHIDDISRSEQDRRIVLVQKFTEYPLRREHDLPNYNRTYDADFTDDEWHDIRMNSVTPRLLSKMLWQHCYRFRHNEDYNAWILSWPVEVRNYATAWIIMKHFIACDVPDEMLFVKAREYFFHHPRTLLALLLRACEYRRVHDRCYPDVDRRVQSRIHVCRSNTKRIWKSMTKVEPHENRLRSIYHVPPPQPLDGDIYDYIAMNQAPFHHRWWFQLTHRLRQYARYIRDLFTAPRLPPRRRVMAEPQAGEENCPLPPSLTSKQRAKIINLCKTLCTAIERHEDKMYKLCKIGRFSQNQGEWDIFLYHRQRRVINKAIHAFRFGLQNYPYYLQEVDRTGLPWTYYNEATFVKCKFEKKIKKMQEDADYSKQLRKLLWITNQFRENMQADFNPDRCFHQDVEQQADEEYLDMSSVKPTPRTLPHRMGSGPVAASTTPAPKKVIRESGAGSAAAATSPPAKMIGEEMDPPLEKTVNLAFADSREVQREKTEMITKPKTQIAVQETSYSMADIFKRPMFINRYLWQKSSTGELARLTVPGVYFSASAKGGVACQPLTVANMLSQFGFTRFDMDFRIQINSNKFQSGLIWVYWEPFFMRERQGIVPASNIFNFRGTWINASSSNSTTLHVGWENVREYFPIYCDNHREYNYWGQLVMYIVNALQTGTSTSTDASISLYAHLSNWEVHQQVNPKPVESITFANDVMIDDFENGHDYEEYPTPEYRLVGKPRMNYRNYATGEIQMEVASGIASEIGASLLESMAQRLARVVADKPLDTKSEKKAKLSVLSPTAHGDGPSKSESLSLTKARVTPVKNHVDTDKPITLRELMERKSLLYTSTIKTTDKEGDSILIFPITPGIQSVETWKNIQLSGQGETWDWGEPKVKWMDSVVTTRAGYVEGSPSMLAYLSNLFLWWTGTIVIELQCVKTDMHTCRLMLRYEPSGSSITAKSECQKAATPGVIWDLNENKEISIDCPYAAPQPFLSTQYHEFSKDQDKASIVGEYAAGIFEISIVNPLKVSTGVADNVPINIYIRAGKDFEFSGLSSLNMFMGIGKYTMKSSSEYKDMVSGYANFLWEYMHYEKMTLRLGTGQKTYFPPTRQVAPFHITEGGVVALYQGVKDQLTAAQETISAKVLKKEDKQLLVMATRWREETARTYQDARAHLDEMGVFRPDFWDPNYLFSDEEDDTMRRWLAIAHMRHHAFTLNELPSHFHLLAKYKSKAMAEIQAGEETMCNNKKPVSGVNPFKDGTNNNVSKVKKLMGEDFNDLYKILRRMYCVLSLSVPYFPTVDTRRNYANWEWEVAHLNEYEKNMTYFDIRIPVHAFFPTEQFGVSGCVTAGGHTSKFYSYLNRYKEYGMNSSSDYNITQLEAFGHLATFWCGEKRYMILITGVPEVYGYVVHKPADYGIFKIGLTSEHTVRQSINYGTLIYKGNVMGGFEVEVPWQSRYSKLVISKTKRSAITDNGTIHIYMPIQVKDDWKAKEGDGCFDARPFKRLNLTLFESMGDNTELFVSRGAPIVQYWPFYVTNRYTDEWQEPVPDIPNEQRIKRFGNLGLGQVSRVIEAYNQSSDQMSVTFTGNEKQSQVLSPLPKYYVEQKHNVKNRAEHKSITKLIHEIETFHMADQRPVASKEDEEKVEKAEKQAGEEEMNPHIMRALEIAADPNQTFADFSKEWLQSPTEDQVDGIMGGQAAPSAIGAMVYTLGKLPSLIDSLNSNLNKASVTMTVTTKAIEAWSSLKDKAASAVGTVGKVGEMAYDVGRLGILAHAIYTFLNAESWPERIMALSIGAVTLGISLDIVKNVGNWLVQNISKLFSSNQVNQNEIFPEQQSGCDNPPIEKAAWYEYVAQHTETLTMLAAGIGAFSAFFFTQTTPGVQQTSKFAGSMLQKLKNFAVVGSAVKTFEWLFTWIAKVIEKSFTWACDLATNGMLTKKILSNKSPELLDWLIEIERFRDETHLLKTVWDDNEKLKVWRLHDQGMKFSKGKFSTNTFIAGQIKQGLTKLTEVEQKMTNLNFCQPCRIDPFCIWLCGKPGVGKSTAMALISTFIADHMQWPQHQRTYSRNETDQFWPGYVGQPIIYIDDVCQFLSENKGIGSQDMIKMKSNVEYLLNMSESKEKGRRFTSQMITCTSNLMYPKPEGMSDVQALWRRRNIVAEAYQPRGQGSFADLRFRLHDPNPGTLAPRENIYLADISFEEFLVHCLVQCRIHIAAQRALVLSSMEGKTIFGFGEEDTAESVYSNHILSLAPALVSAYRANRDLDGRIIEILMRWTNAEWKILRSVEPVIGAHWRAVTEVVRKQRQRGDRPENWEEPNIQPMELMTKATARAKTMEKCCNSCGNKNATCLHVTVPAVDELLRGATAYEGIPQVWSDEEEDDILCDQATLHDNARRAIETRKGMSECFRRVEMANMRANPIGKQYVYADDGEIMTTVKQIHPSITEAEAKEKAQQYKQIFENFNNSKIKPTPQLIDVFLNPRIKEMFEKVGDEWMIKAHLDRMEFSSAINDPELHQTECEAVGWWLEYDRARGPLKDQMRKDLSDAMTPQSTEDGFMTKSVKLVQSYFKSISEAANGFFDRHPKFKQMLKMGSILFGIFAAYKLLHLVCGDTMKKIDDKLKSWFGLYRETKPVQYVVGIGESGFALASEWKEKIRDTLRGKADPNLAIVPEGQAIDLVATEMHKLLPSAVIAASLKAKSAIEESKSEVIRRVSPYESGATIKQKPVVNKQSCLEFKTPESIAIEKQGASDQTSLQIRLAVKKNLARVTTVLGTKLRRLTGVFILGRILMLPFHFLEGLEEGAEISISCGNENIREIFSMDKYCRLGRTDCVLYAVGMRIANKRSILEHFCTEEYFDKIMRTAAVLQVLEETQDICMYNVEATQIPGVLYKDDPRGEKYDNERTWEYSCSTKKGDCGALLFANNNAITKKIIGMHIAGKPTEDIGFALGISREQLDKALEFFGNEWKGKPIVIPNCFMSDGPENIKFKPEGHFEILGVAKPALRVRLPEKTEIKPSPIHGLVKAPETEPAILTPNDERWVWNDTPLSRSTSKYGIETKPFRYGDLVDAAKHISSEISTWKKVMEPRLMTDHEAVFGNEFIPYCERMNMASAPGWPWALERPSGEKGKAYLYDFAAEDGIANEKYRVIYRDRERLAKEGVPGIHVWTLSLKDERVSQKKIAAGLTRNFVIASADYTQLVRKYFLAFNVNFYANHIRLFSAVGIDPYSYEWTRLWRRLTRVGKYGFAGDYKNFDGFLDPDVMKMFVKIVNDWYDDGEQNALVRETLMDDMIHSVMIMHRIFIQKFNGNPSGCPETTALNTICNDVMILVSWIEIMRKECPTLMQLYNFERFVELAIYGDDIFVAVHRLVQEYFNFITVSQNFREHGIIFTDEQKGDGEEEVAIRPLTECTFLKNHFRQMEEYNIILAPIAERTIYELLNWVRQSDDDVTQLRENLVDVFKFAFHHGRKFFERLKSDVNKALRVKGLRPFEASYSLMREEFLDACTV